MREWEKLMQAWTNPVEFEKTEFAIEPTPEQLEEIEYARKLQQRIREIVAEKYDPIFVEQINTDRSLIDKKQT